MMEKTELFSLLNARVLDGKDLLGQVRQRFVKINKKTNFAPNSLGAPHKNAKTYVNIFLDHWEKYGVDGHYIPMIGIGDHPTGYADFRKMFREYSIRLLGARLQSETAIVNDQSTAYANLLRWLLEKQLRIGRNIVLYEATGAFPSDEAIISETVRIINLGVPQGSMNLELVPIPQNDLGLIDHDKLILLIEEIGNQLGVVAFGSGGINWKTAQLLDMKRIGLAVTKVGGKSIVNIAHALGIVDLKLHEYGITVGVGCLYKFMSAGAGGPSLVFVHESEDTSTLLPVGWFSFENPISTLQGLPGSLKKGAQRIEASNPQVLGWLPAFAALEEYCKWNKVDFFEKGQSLVNYFDQLMSEVQKNFDSPIEIITPNNERSTEIVFRCKNSQYSKDLHTFLNDSGIVCDIRDGERIRIGMFPLVTTYSEVCSLFNKIYDFFFLRR